jgi:hypothetical protein
VGQLGLTVTLHGGLIGLLGETEGIEESNRSEDTGKILGDEGAEGGGLLDRRGRGEGGGRADESEEGGGELHVFYFFSLFGFVSLSDVSFPKLNGSDIFTVMGVGGVRPSVT